ncbi:MAG TPA: L-sorbosone dehydrogenase [Lacipirellulaceae bacterium]|nr:L-sorbosone dehydrogenase [Lacipirellulaceae bacterium]
MKQPKVPPGFRIELVHAPPLDSEGSWVSLAVDDRGRLFASDQYGAIYFIVPSQIGTLPSASRVTRIGAGVGAAQGMTFVGGALYVVVNGQVGQYRSGLYRVTDPTGDDKFDKVEEIIPLRGSGEHGPHAVVASPDEKSLYLCAGNYTGSPRFTASRVPAGWGEDQLLPRLDDPVAQATGIPAPGGWIVRLSLDGQQCELVSVGYRNIYDMAFNRDGELFTFESDLDVDIGTPWYRPPSLLHVVSGADYGWRGGDGIWPTHNPQTLPPVATSPPGSPTGLVSGRGARFPERYQNALFVGDWSRGVIYAVHLTPAGASYRGECEPMAEGVAGVTDLVVRPHDGALYFTVGGRRTQSGLYRIVWVDSEAKPELGSPDIQLASLQSAGADARAMRHSLESLHSSQQSNIASRAWPGLSSSDRFIRYAALKALERTNADAWQARAMQESNVLAKFTALIALARRDEPLHPDRWVDAVLSANFRELSPEAQQTVVCATALGVMRFKSLTPVMLQRVAVGVASWLPTERLEVDRELAKLLVRLQCSNVLPFLITQLNDSSSEQAIQAAVTLSAATVGWTPESRTALLDWFDQAATRYGQRSFYPYLVAARARFIASFSADDRKAFLARLAPPSPRASESLGQVPRQFVKEWTVEEVTAVVSEADANRGTAMADASTGGQLYAELGCAGCHAIAGVGTSVGPDLGDLSRRFSVEDIARAIVEPSAAIPDLYRQMTFVVNGRSIVGRVTNMTATTISVSTDVRDPARAVTLRRVDIESRDTSPISPMPAKLLDTLSANEIVSLFDFLREPTN